MELLIKQDLPIPQYTNRHTSLPLNSIEKEQAPEIDLSSREQYTPECVHQAPAFFLTARNNIEDREKPRADFSAAFIHGATPEVHSSAGPMGDVPQRALGLIPNDNSISISSGPEIVVRPTSASPVPLLSPAIPGSTAPYYTTMLTEDSWGWPGRYRNGLGSMDTAGVPHPYSGQLSSTLDNLQVHTPIAMNGMSIPAHQTGFGDISVRFSGFPGYSPPPNVRPNGVPTIFTPASTNSTCQYEEKVGHGMIWNV